MLSRLSTARLWAPSQFVVLRGFATAAASIAPISSPRSSSEYASKVCTAEEAIAHIPDGSLIWVAGNAGTPRSLLQALAARKDIDKGIRLAHVLLLGRDPFVGREDKFHHIAYFVGPADRAAVNSGKSTFIPIHLHHIPRALRRGDDFDAVLLNVSPPDNHGYMSVGVEVMATRAALEKGKRVIVQVNENMPRIHGDTYIHVSEVHHIVEKNEPLAELEVPPPTDVQHDIAKHIVPLIPNGATLQLGIGGVPDAVLRIISERNTPLSRSDLRIHTEMVSDGVIDAVEKGAVSDKHKILLTFAMGTKRLYNFLHENPLIEGRPCDYVNDPYVIAKNDNMVAINSALSVDLTGQVNSDSVGTRIYSGFGGQIDFIRGASEAKGGVPVIALPATAKEGAASRIVPTLMPGAGVVTTRADVAWVVTEFGAVNLAGKNLHERAELLISIAHPKFRDELRRQSPLLQGSSWYRKD